MAGFTLIELMIIVTIIGILTALVVQTNGGSKIGVEYYCGKSAAVSAAVQQCANDPSCHVTKDNYQEVANLQGLCSKYQKEVRQKNR